MLSVLSNKKQGEESVQVVSVNGPEEYEETQMTTSEVEDLIKMKIVGKLKNDAKVMHSLFQFSFNTTLFSRIYVNLWQIQL